MNGEAGKGDRTRPFDREKFSEGWDRVFGGKPMTVKEKVKQGDAYLTEILNEMGGGSAFCTNKFMVSRQDQRELVAFIDITSNASIGWKEPLSKSLICERLIEAHQSVLILAQQNIEQLQRIKDKG